MTTGQAWVLLCALCGRSYDRTLSGDIISVIVWAAERARRFERKRERLRQRLNKAGLLPIARKL